MISILFNLMGKMLILVAFGYFLRKKNIITEEYQKGLTDIMMIAALPCSVLATAGNKFSPEQGKNIIIIFSISFLYYLLTLVLAWLISKKLSIPDKAKRSFIAMSVFANSAFVGFPLATELLGSEGLLLAIVFNLSWLILFFTVGVSLFSGEKELRISAIFKTPSSAASFIAFIIYLSPITLSGLVLDTLQTVGNMVVPISMMLIGCSLVKVNLLDIIRDPKAWMVSFMKLIFFPVIMMVLMLVIPGIPNIVKVICCLMSCIPSGSLCVVFAQQYDCEPEYASRAVVQSMLVMLITIPVYLGIATSVFPV